MSAPRILLCAAGSGSGKTTVTCGILQAFVDRGLRTTAFKCGPDYIDPMFHTKVIGAPSRNLDAFFADAPTVRGLLNRNTKNADIAVIEGVMGYYDGIVNTDMASSYEVACMTQTPAVLIVNGQGMSLSVAAMVKGFAEFRKDSNIKGVILNRVSPMIYPELKAKIEAECGVTVYGYVPKLTDLQLESRHLGLKQPEEVAGLQEKLHALAAQLEKTLDLDALYALAQTAPVLNDTLPVRPQLGAGLRLGVAQDVAFCFYYADNLDLFRDYGVEIVPFSPMQDKALPAVDGIYLGGGYPELHLETLSKNTAMLDSIRTAHAQNLPIFAECGGFLYLHNRLEDMHGAFHTLVGLVDADAYYKGKLGRFGYIELTTNADSLFGAVGTKCKGHEFHYFDTHAVGDAMTAVKPVRGTTWQCATAQGNLFCGFPHLYFYSNPCMLENFIERLRVHHTKKVQP